MYTAPIKPDPGYVWIVLLTFFGVGMWLVGQGRANGSVGAEVFGAILIAAGIYYSVRWFLALGRDREQ